MGSHTRNGEFCSISLRTEQLHKLFGILLPGRFVFSSTSISSIIYLFQYGLKDLFYTLGYNPIVLYLLHCSNCSIFSHWELFQLPSTSLRHTLSSCAFLKVIPYFLALRDTPDSSCIFPDLALKIFLQGVLVPFIGEQLKKPRFGH